MHRGEPAPAAELQGQRQADGIRWAIAVSGASAGVLQGATLDACPARALPDADAERSVARALVGQAQAEAPCSHLPLALAVPGLYKPAADLFAARSFVAVGSAAAVARSAQQVSSLPEWKRTVALPPVMLGPEALTLSARADEPAKLEQPARALPEEPEALA